MTSPAEVNPTLGNPYVGPRPFESEDRARFFGRDREANEIVSLVIAHRAVLLYAESGAGKSSLINAGIVPRLVEEEGFEVFPPARVRGLIHQSIWHQDIANLYVFNTLLSWAGDETDQRSLAQSSLADFLRDSEHPVDEDGLPVPRVVIFDQFEELFTFFPERWQDREDFFKQVSEALTDDPLLRVIFVMREDYIAQMDPHASLLPENLRTRFRLERMGGSAALAAITGPLRDMGRTYAEGAAESLVEELLKTQVQVAAAETLEVVGRFVEPVQLQVVCEGLWRELPPDITMIQQSHLRAFGDVDRALARFYENAILAASGQTGVRVDDLRQWFDGTLITPAGTRGSVFRGAEETSGVPNSVVDILEDLHLIRAEVRAGARWYELTHDRFIEPIRNANEESNRIRERRERRRVQVRYGVIFSLTIALLAVFIGISVFAFFSRVEAQKQAANAAILAAIAQVESANAIEAREFAEKQEGVAEKARQVAIKARGDAERQAQQAVEARATAVEQANIADAERQNAEDARLAAVEQALIADGERLKAAKAQTESALQARNADFEREKAVAAQVEAERQKRIADVERIKAEAAKLDAETQASIADAARKQAIDIQKFAEDLARIAEIEKQKALAAEGEILKVQEFAEKALADADQANAAAVQARQLAEEALKEADVAKAEAQNNAMFYEEALEFAASLIEDLETIKAAEGVDLETIYQSMRIGNLETDRATYTIGDRVKTSYELVNTLGRPLIIPLDNDLSVGVRQHWIERLGSDPDILLLTNANRPRSGKRYAAGAALIRIGKEIEPFQKISFVTGLVCCQTLDTTGFPAGQYRYYVEYRRLDDNSAIQTVTVDFGVE